MGRWSIDRPADNGWERGRLPERQPAHGLAEIVFGSGLETIIPGTEINLVTVHREDLFFGVMTLDLQREDGLLKLAMEAAVGAIEEKPAGKLHGQRAGALGDAMTRHVMPGSLENAREIDTPVLFEVLVLGRDDRIP